ncbi:MAG TPA: hypothetical protein VF699_05550 [Caulobacteraceae bacterium]
MLLLLAALAAAAPSTAPAAPTPFSDGRPPAQFQGSATVTIEVGDQARIDRVCHPLFGRPPEGMKTDACHTGERVVLPNPCTFPQSDGYAKILCHELGHANGWSANHDDPSAMQAAAPSPRRAASTRRR